MFKINGLQTDTFGGIGFSIFPWRGKGHKGAILSRSFFRVAYSVHNISQDYTDKKLNEFHWDEKSHGLELGVGIRVRKSWYVFEFSPLVVFFPLSKKIDGFEKKAYQNI